MATAPKLPPNEGEALDILRRLEPILADIRTDQKETRSELHRLGEAVAELKGRVAGIEGRLGQLPTLWTLAGLVVAIFGFAFVLLRFAAPAVHP